MRNCWTMVALSLGATLILGAEAPARDGPCVSEAHDLARPLVGTWHEFTITAGGEVFEGELHSTLEAGGCAFVQSFVSADGTFTFRSLGYVDPDRRAWVEQFVLSNGRTAVYEWARDGADILLNRLSSEPDHYRLRVTDLKEDSYVVIEERRTAAAPEWTQGERTITRRAGSAE
jgi:hypothetical protein